MIKDKAWNYLNYISTLPTNSTNEIWENARQMFRLVSAPILNLSLTSFLKLKKKYQYYLQFELDNKSVKINYFVT